MVEMITGLVVGFSICLMFTAWLASRQHKWFTGQLTSLSQTAHEGISRIGSELEETREALNATALEHRSEYSRAIMLDSALKKRIKQVEDLQWQVKVLERSAGDLNEMNLRFQRSNKELESELAAAKETLGNIRGNFNRSNELHGEEVKKLELRIQKEQLSREALQTCIDAFAETAAYQGVDLEREIDERCCDA